MHKRIQHKQYIHTEIVETYLETYADRIRAHFPDIKLMTDINKIFKLENVGYKRKRFTWDDGI